MWKVPFHIGAQKGLVLGAFWISDSQIRGTEAVSYCVAVSTVCGGMFVQGLHQRLGPAWLRAHLARIIPEPSMPPAVFMPNAPPGILNMEALLPSMQGGAPFLQ